MLYAQHTSAVHLWCVQPCAHPLTPACAHPLIAAWPAPYQDFPSALVEPPHGLAKDPAEAIKIEWPPLSGNTICRRGHGDQNNIMCWGWKVTGTHAPIAGSTTLQDCWMKFTRPIVNHGCRIRDLCHQNNQNKLGFNTSAP